MKKYFLLIVLTIVMFNISKAQKPPSMGRGYLGQNFQPYISEASKADTIDRIIYYNGVHLLDSSVPRSFIKRFFLAADTCDSLLLQSDSGGDSDGYGIYRNLLFVTDSTKSGRIIIRGSKYKQ